MKHLFTSLAVALAAVTTVHAGTYYSSMDRPSSEAGRGFYFGLQGGFNLYQATGSYRIDDVTVSSDSNLGGFGGLKLGYVAGSVLDTIRPSIELDGFYNGCSQDIDASYHIFKAKVGKIDMDSGALLVNGIIRFPVGAFQPYVGAGIGGYTMELKTRFAGFDFSDNTTSWAWQLVAGVDYYFTQDISVFTEYKFLNYMDGSDRTGQQLLGGGVRFHF